MGFRLTAFRAALFSAYFFALTAVLGVAGVGVRLFARRHAYAFARAWIWRVLWGARVICGIRYELTGAENLPAPGAAILACQHQSAFDTLVWITLLPAVSYILKQELTHIPLFGPLLRPAGMIPVDRSAGALALRGLLAATSHAAKNGRQIVMFPEGTRMPPGRRGPLQPGIAAIAMRLDLPVIPVATNSGLFWGKRRGDKHPGTIRIAVCPPLPAGLPREALLKGIDRAWRDAEARGFAAVDNSVGETATELSHTVK